MHRTKTILFLLLGLFVLTTLMSISWGSVAIPIQEVLSILVGQPASEESWHAIVWDFRLPRTLTAILAGCSLAVSGLLMQTFFRNPIAGPFVLGISSGASLGVALFMMAGLQQFLFWQGAWGQILAASIGSCMVLGVLLMISWSVRNIHVLLIIGLMLGSITGAIVSILQFFSTQNALQQFVLWSMGDLNGVTWPELYWLMPVVCLFFGWALLLTRSLDVLLLGNTYAQSLGVKVRALRLSIIAITGVLAGSITAFCGPIAFLGVATPHLARSVFKTHRHDILLIACMLMGSIILLACQLVGQLWSTSYTLPINILTSLFGAPIVIWMLTRSLK